MKRFMLFQMLFLGSLIIGRSQDFSTLSEIYNFDVGDEFQFYQKESHSPGVINHFLRRSIVTDKIIKADTLIYFQNISLFACDNQIPIPLITDTVSMDSVSIIIITPIDSLLGNMDTTYNDPGLYNGRKINHQKMGQNNDYQFNLYVEGCGLARHFYFSSIGIYAKLDSLFYFKKGSEEWGIKVLSGILESETNELIELFPNPVESELSIICPSPISGTPKIFLLNIYGERLPVDVLNIRNEILNINCSGLSNGLYFLLVQSNDHYLSRSFIKR